MFSSLSTTNDTKSLLVIAPEIPLAVKNDNSVSRPTTLLDLLSGLEFKVDASTKIGNENHGTGKFFFNQNGLMDDFKSK